MIYQFITDQKLYEFILDLHHLLKIFILKENNGYELRFTDGLLNYDLFIHYKHNQTHDWSTYQLGRNKYKYILNFTFFHLNFDTVIDPN